MCVKPILLQNVPVDYPLGISASNIFEGFPEVKKDLWGGEFLEDGCLVRIVGDKVTPDLIRGYIQYHHDEVQGK
jgi:REP element-mobilizing transposase RayT